MGASTTKHVWHVGDTNEQLGRKQKKTQHKQRKEFVVCFGLKTKVVPTCVYTKVCM